MLMLAGTQRERRRNSALNAQPARRFYGSFSACHLGERERQQGLALAAPRKGHGGGHNELRGVRDQPRQQARRFHEERHIQGCELVVGNKFKRVQHQAATAF